MKAEFLIIIICVLIYNLSSLLFCQNHDNLPNYQGTFFYYSNISVMPPLNTDMPFDVMIGYIALDSLRRNGDYSLFKEFINNQTYNDTIRTIFKYYYKMLDWNPMLFQSYIKNTDYCKLPLPIIQDEIVEKYFNISPSRGNSLVALSYFIYHIRVLDTLRFIDSTSFTYQRGLKCYSEILNIHKGNILESNCNIQENNLSVKNNDIYNDSLQINNPILCFDIRLDWYRGEDIGDVVLIGNDNYPWCRIKEKMVDSLNIPWIKSNQEYIVFLKPVLIDYHDNYNKYQLFPVDCNSLTKGIYPIINGYVQDPSNDFGLGTSVPYLDFIQNLNNIINEIKNYNN